ncbi:MAG: SulP family inorganic anion transporter [Saprospiraceae bacterium]
MQNANYLQNLKFDFAAGLVVFLVALPLCLGIALASGAPLFSGLISGVIGGVVVGVLSASHTSVSGPAAGLTAVVLIAITTLQRFEIFLVCVVLAGVIQILLGYLKAGTIANYFPNSVIKGMLTGIGIIIVLKQIPHALGYDKDAEGDLSFWEAGGSNTFSSLWNALTVYIHPGATLTAIISLAILGFWEKWEWSRRLSFLPGALVAVIASILLNAFYPFLGEKWVIDSNHLVNLPVFSGLSAFLDGFTFPDIQGALSAGMVEKVLAQTLTIAAIASIETLLCIEAVDKLDPYKRVSNPNVELKAQGVGNILSGLIGGLPITSVIVRSSANLNAGARTKMAAIIHGVLMLLCVLLIPNLLNKIPLAALAAILIQIGYKLAKPTLFKKMWENGKYQFWPFVVTVVAIVLTDLLTGVVIGLFASIFALLRGNMKNSYFFRKEKFQDGEIIKIKLSQEVSFLNKASIKLTLEHLPEGSTVVIDAKDTAYIDFDVLEIIHDFAEVKAPAKGINLTLEGFHDRYEIGDINFVSHGPKGEIKNS